MGEKRKEALKKRVNEIIKLSTIPSIISKIIEITNDEDSTIADLERVIEHDQAIASRVVGISNAVYYGFPRKITSISQAILILGFEMVKGLAISTAVIKGISGQDKEAITALWRHSYETALASVLIAEKSGLVNKDSAFLSGLLHDIGRPILSQVLGKEYTMLAMEDSLGLVECEEEAFGASHAEAGAWFVDRCKLPNDCVNSIRYHHDPQRYQAKTGGPFPPLIPIVYLANAIVLDGNGNKCKYTSVSQAHAEAVKAVNLTGEGLAEIKEKVDGLKGQIADYYT